MRHMAAGAAKEIWYATSMKVYRFGEYKVHGHYGSYSH
jgi:hypothetical protein